MAQVKLTPRQIDVFNFLVMALSSKEIAVRLGLSHRTVEDHRHDIFRRFDVPDLPHLIRKAYNLGGPPHLEGISHEDLRCDDCACVDDVDSPGVAVMHDPAGG